MENKWIETPLNDDLSTFFMQHIPNCLHVIPLACQNK